MPVHIKLMIFNMAQSVSGMKKPYSNDFRYWEARAVPVIVMSYFTRWAVSDIF